MRPEVREFLTRVTTDDEFIARIPTDVDEITRAKLVESHSKDIRGYIDKMQEIYGYNRPIEALETTLEWDTLDLLVEFNRQDKSIIKVDPDCKHRIAMGIIGHVLESLILQTNAMRIRLKPSFYNRYKQTPFMYGQTFSEFVEGVYKKDDMPPSNEFDEEAIKKALEKDEVFEQVGVIPIRRIYDLLINNKIINKYCSMELFERCLDRADITKIMIAHSKTVLMIFMKEIAYKYSNTDDYLRAAEKSFVVKKGKLGATGNASITYDRIFGEVLPRIDHRTKLK